jgi:3-methyladenine DNA glycosylase/8-oxoguanine DNA glycosylase
MSKARCIVLPRTARSKLARADAALGLLMDRVGPFRMEAGNPEGPLCALVRSIVYQQLSGKAAATIFGRLRGLFAGADFPSCDELTAASDEAIRGCGVSSQKLGYLRDLCRCVSAGQLDLHGLPDLSDELVIEQLTTVRGIGRWSAQMYLMFYLGRLDVWPEADLGIRSAVRLLHGHDEMPSAGIMIELGARYRPYASVASWYLWRLHELADEERDDLLLRAAATRGRAA